MLSNVSWKRFAVDLKHEVKDDNVSNGAAAIAYYLMFSLFPAMIALLTILPFLPIANLEQAIMDFLAQALPSDAYALIGNTVREIVANQHGGILTFGLLLAVWSASAGMVAIMQQLNITYDVKEGRSFIKVRGTAILLTLAFGVLVAGAFALVVTGGIIQSWLADELGWSTGLTTAFAALRWVIILAALLLAFAITYYFGPDVEQNFRFITPGSVFGVVAIAVAAVAFRAYVENFGHYSKIYGAIGAVIILMLWLYITGLVLLLGSEINALAEHYSAEGKQKGEKAEGARYLGHPQPV